MIPTNLSEMLTALNAGTVQSTDVTSVLAQQLRAQGVQITTFKQQQSGAIHYVLVR